MTEENYFHAGRTQEGVRATPRVRSLPRTDAAGIVLAVATALVGVAFWTRLPAEMAIHFDVSGTPDNFVPKVVGVFFLPVLMPALLAFMNVAARLDPPDGYRVFDVTKLWTVAILAYVQGFVVAWNLGHELPMSLVLAPVLGSAAVLVVWSVLAERRAGVG